MKKFLKSIIFALFVYFLDALVFNQGVIALIVALVAVLILVPKTFIALFKRNKELSRERIIRSFIYVIMAVLVLSSNALNNQLAQRRAQNIIQACENYKAKYARYPDKLKELVPEFIPRLPLAKFTLNYNNFMYIARPESNLLVYYVMPPFGRKLYNFQLGRWGYLD